MQRVPALSSRVLLLVLATGTAQAAEDVSFVAEHLPEVAMDNRYAGLPLDAARVPRPGHWVFSTAAGYTRIETGSSALSGPLLAASVGRVFRQWRMSFLLFHDTLDFSGGAERRPLDEPFVTSPITLPVDAEIRGFTGSALDAGAGVSFSRSLNARWLGDIDLTLGVFWQRLELDRYRTGYRILAGPQSGATGILDYGGTYEHVVPVFDLGKYFGRENWGFAPHVRLAMPLPRRAMVGRFTGPGFDLAGDTASNGAGKHFGDPSVTLGFDVTYLPWNLSIDAGGLVSQQVVEPFIHEGVGADWMINFRWMPFE